MDEDVPATPPCTPPPPRWNDGTGMESNSKEPQGCDLQGLQFPQCENAEELRKSPNNVTRASQFWLAQKALFKQYPNYPNISNHELEVIRNAFTEIKQRSQLDLVLHPAPSDSTRRQQRADPLGRLTAREVASAFQLDNVKVLYNASSRMAHHKTATLPAHKTIGTPEERLEVLRIMREQVHKNEAVTREEVFYLMQDMLRVRAFECPTLMSLTRREESFLGYEHYTRVSTDFFDSLIAGTDFAFGRVNNRIAKQRADDFTIKNAVASLSEFEAILKKEDFLVDGTTTIKEEKLRNIVNVDESSALAPGGNGVWTFYTKRQSRRAADIVGEEKTQRKTILAGITLDLEKVPPLIISPREQRGLEAEVSGLIATGAQCPEEVVELAEGEELKFFHESTKTAMINGPIFVRYLHSLRRWYGHDEKVIILVDGHSTRKMYETYLTCRRLNFVMCLIYPNCTHGLQPLDKVFQNYHFKLKQIDGLLKSPTLSFDKSKKKRRCLTNHICVVAYYEFKVGSFAWETCGITKERRAIELLDPAPRDTKEVISDGQLIMPINYTRPTQPPTSTDSTQPQHRHLDQPRASNFSCIADVLRYHECCKQKWAVAIGIRDRKIQELEASVLHLQARIECEEEKQKQKGRRKGRTKHVGDISKYSNLALAAMSTRQSRRGSPVRMPDQDDIFERTIAHIAERESLSPTEFVRNPSPIAKKLGIPYRSPRSDSERRAFILKIGTKLEEEAAQSPASTHHNQRQHTTSPAVTMTRDRSPLRFSSSPANSSSSIASSTTNSSTLQQRLAIPEAMTQTQVASDDRDRRVPTLRKRRSKSCSARPCQPSDSFSLISFAVFEDSSVKDTSSSAEDCIAVSDKGCPMTSTPLSNRHMPAPAKSNKANRQALAEAAELQCGTVGNTGNRAETAPPGDALSFL